MWHLKLASLHVAPNTFGAQYYKVLKRKSQIWLWRSTNLLHIVNYSVKGGGGEEGDLPNVGKLRRLKTVFFEGQVAEQR